MLLTLAECKESEDSIRLVNSSGSSNDNSGLVEICAGGRWHRVCHKNWDRTEAALVCDELGLPSSGFIVSFWYRLVLAIAIMQVQLVI